MLLSRRALLAAFASPGVKREIFLGAAGRGVAVMAFACYVKPRGGEMVSVEERWTHSDTIDVAYVRRSRDYGRTWSTPVEF
jgi:hypothetical protein